MSRMVTPRKASQMRIASAATILVALTAVTGCTDKPQRDPCADLHLDYQAAAEAYTEANNLTLGVVFQAGELDPALISDGRPIDARGIIPGTEASEALQVLLVDRELREYIDSFVDNHQYGHYSNAVECRPEPPQP